MSHSLLDRSCTNRVCSLRVFSINHNNFPVHLAIINHPKRTQRFHLHSSKLHGTFIYHQSSHAAAQKTNFFCWKTSYVRCTCWRMHADQGKKIEQQRMVTHGHSWERTSCTLPWAWVALPITTTSTGSLSPCKRASFNIIIFARVFRVPGVLCVCTANAVSPCSFTSAEKTKGGCRQNHPITLKNTIFKIAASLCKDVHVIRRDLVAPH